MKKTTLILTSAALAGSLVLAPYTIQLNDQNIQRNEEVLKESTADAANIPWLVKQGLFYIVKKGSNKYYNVKPGVTYGAYADKITPGSIYYNSGTSGGGSYYDFKVASTKHKVMLYAESALYLIFTGKITIMLSDPGNDWVVNKTVTPGQWTTYTPKRTGNYRAMFVQNKSQKWTPFIEYRHNRGKIVSFDNQYNSENQSILVENTVAAAPHGQGKGKGKGKKMASDHMVTISKYGNVIEPSDNHKNKRNNNNNNQQTKTYLTADQLDQQFIDEDLGIHVYSMKDYAAGDNVYFKDTIQSVQYDKETKSTFFTFDSTSEYEQKLYFAGDLTEKYKAGQQLKLKFKVEALEKNNDKISIINYYKFGLDNNGKTPDIKRFLVE